MVACARPGGCLGGGATLAFEPVAWAFLAPLGVAGVRAVPARAATAARLAPRAGLRPRLPVRAAGLDARGRPRRVARARGVGGALLRAAGAGGRAAACGSRALAAVDGAGLGGRPRSGAASWPFSGMPWGRLAFAVVGHPAAPRRCRGSAPPASAWLVALIGTGAGLDARRRLAETEGRRRDGGGRRGRGRRARPGAVHPAERRLGHRRGRAGRRPRRRHRHPARPPAGDPQPRRRHRWRSRPTWTRAASPLRTSSSGRRTPPPSTRSATPRSTLELDTAAEAIGVPILVGAIAERRGPATCSTRASSGTRQSGRG